jgi:hypothetical protein
MLPAAESLPLAANPPGIGPPCHGWEILGKSLNEMEVFNVKIMGTYGKNHYKWSFVGGKIIDKLGDFPASHGADDTGG